MVDEAVQAAKTAAILDAVRRVREMLPKTAAFVAIQESLSLATHWLSDEGWTVPATYGEVFLALADRGVIAATGLRNLTII